MSYYFFELNVCCDERGYLAAIEGVNDIPFDIKRVFYIYDNKKSLQRAGHSNLLNEQVLICLGGSCRVFLDDGNKQEHFILKQPERGLYISSNVWVELDEFSPSCILLVLASKPYDPADQICDYQTFKEIVK